MAANHAGVQTIAGNTPISTSAYSTLFSSTPYLSSKLILANSCDQNVIVAIGAAGSEVDLACVAKGAQLNLDLSLNVLPVGSRIAVLAAGAATTSGYFTASVIP